MILAKDRIILNHMSMWRSCDLHTHTVPNEQDSSAWDAAAFIGSCVDLGLDVVGVTDHDEIERVAAAVAAAAALSLEVIPGVEISTDRGHVLALSPGKTGLEQLNRFVTRLGVAPGRQSSIDETIRLARTDFRLEILLIGAHVDADGSLLARNNTLSLEGQIDLASSLDALEVESGQKLAEWLSGGVKQEADRPFTLLQGSDRHALVGGSGRRTWIYLPELEVRDFQHAFAVPEASIRFDAPMKPPTQWIKGIEFSGGLHDGLSIQLCERSNALIGPPNVGKTLIVDALKFVFDMKTGITEVDQLTKARMEACLSPGDTVRVQLKTDEGIEEIERTFGAAAIPSTSLTPIVFSQTELVRRAHEPEPSMELLDMHVAGTSELKRRLEEIARGVHDLFNDLVENAREASILAETVENPLDGLEPIRLRLAELSGAETVAKLSNDVARVATWRERLRVSLDNWKAESDCPLPEIPPQPDFETSDEEIIGQIPSASIKAALDTYKQEHQGAKTALLKAIDRALADGEAPFETLKGETEVLLEAQGFTAGSEALSEIETLRARALELEETASKLKRLDSDLEAGLDQLKKNIAGLESLRGALRNLRKRACARINQSMRSFAAMVREDSETARLDELIDDLKTGTWLGVNARTDLRKTLDRPRVLERAIRLNRNDLSALPDSKEFENQDEVVREATERGKLVGLVDLACLWPGDGLDLLYLGDSPPSRFSTLTEGLRALAIKEISFADSPLPVISDQPEDAVPTRSVYENLVPTLRRQRARRQFLVISHDANIVVAGDVDKVIVLTGDASEPVVEGTLQDDAIRIAALEHLEGGEAAFEVRSRRYGRR